MNESCLSVNDKKPPELIDSFNVKYNIRILALERIKFFEIFSIHLEFFLGIE